MITSSEAKKLVFGLFLVAVLISACLIIFFPPNAEQPPNQDSMRSALDSDNNETELSNEITEEIPPANKEAPEQGFSIFKITSRQWLMVIVAITMVPIIVKVAQFVLTGSRENVAAPWSRSISDMCVEEERNADSPKGNDSQPISVADALESVLSQSQEPNEPNQPKPSTEHMSANKPAPSSPRRVIRDNVGADQDENKPDDEQIGKIKRVIRG